MITAFINYIKKEKLFSPAEKVLLTVSGGIDSILMCELFHKAGFKFGIAHCNFQLRAKESEDDETFVRSLAKKYDVPFYTVKFNTSIYAKKNKLSIQVAARQLRYQWFEEVREQNNFKFIATAHHQDDSIETFFINIIRGTGISGLHGILPKQGKIIRPMLFATKNDIKTFVKKHKLKFREDSSNASDKYVRNKIRHQVIPVLKELNPSLENTIITNIQHLRDVEFIYRKDIEAKLSKIVKHEKSVTLISITLLKKLNPINTYLYEFLKPFNFNAITSAEIISALDAESGKMFFSATHRLIKDRSYLIVEPIVNITKTKITKQTSKNSLIQISNNDKGIELDTIKLKFKSKINDSENKMHPSIANLDFDKLTFPLELRKWQKGDQFYPLGMKGKKKLSDYFIDKKFSINQKESTWLLTSNGEIVWIIGQRIDERFKITNSTKKIYIVELV